MLSVAASCRNLKESDVARIMAQVLSAVRYCHKRHIVHRFVPHHRKFRDLTVDNIMLLQNRIGSVVKISDFGACRLLRPLSESSNAPV